MRKEGPATCHTAKLGRSMGANYYTSLYREDPSSAASLDESDPRLYVQESKVGQTLSSTEGCLYTGVHCTH